MKTCTKCKLCLTHECFTKDRSRQDGLFPWCRACCKADKHARYSRDPDAAKAKARVGSAKWRSNNPERRREILRANAERHRERYSAGKRAWAAANAERVKDFPSIRAKRLAALERRAARAAKAAQERAERAAARARMGEVGMGEKRCNRCRCIQPLANFNVHRPPTRRDNRHPWCRSCLGEYVRAKNAENPERYRGPSRRAREELRDSYVRAYLSDGTGVPGSLFPVTLIEAQRAKITLHRELRKRRKT